jgi:hypothetical protein
MTLRPGKGFMGIANEESLEFLHEAINDVHAAYLNAGGDSTHDEDPRLILKELLTKEGWSPENDTFGKKAFKSIPVGEGAYRVTLVLTKNGDLRLDVRSWFDPDA